MSRIQTIRAAIGAYRRWGFTIDGEVVTDIGGGLFMDDYRMSRLSLDGGVPPVVE